jgi:hypothetical protein
MLPYPAIRRLGVLAAVLLLASACSPSGTGDESANAQLDSRPASTPVASDPGTGAAADTASAPGAESQATSLLDQYGREAAELASALAAGDGRDALGSRAEGLIDRAAEIVPAFVERHPHCAPYLEAALQVREAWPNLDAETIERDYHHDGALPKIENAGFCYHMKDLVTHPATALVLLSQDPPDYLQAKAEIDEVIAHLGVVRGQL